MKHFQELPGEDLMEEALNEGIQADCLFSESRKGMVVLQELLAEHQIEGVAAMFDAAIERGVDGVIRFDTSFTGRFTLVFHSERMRMDHHGNWVRRGSPEWTLEVNSY